MCPTLETKQRRRNRSNPGTSEQKGGSKEANVVSGTRLSTPVNGRHLYRFNRPPLLASGCVVLELSYMSEYNVAGFATSDVDSSNSGLTTPASSQSNAIGPPKVEQLLTGISEAGRERRGLCPVWPQDIVADTSRGLGCEAASLAEWFETSSVTNFRD